VSRLKLLYYLLRLFRFPVRTGKRTQHKREVSASCLTAQLPLRSPYQGTACI